MAQYYFVTSSLPRLQFGEEPELSFPEFVELLQANLTDRDLTQVAELRRLIDIYNLSAYWRREPFDELGNFNRLELDEHIQRSEDLPDYLLDFLDRYDSDAKRLEHHAELVHLFFKDAIQKTSGLLCRYFQFERDWRLVTVALRAKQLKRDLVQELQYEDPTDPLVGQLIAQKDTKDFEPPAGFEQVGLIYEEYKNEPRRLYIALEEFRFNRVGEMRESELFSLDYILGYMVQLMILEKGRELAAWQA
jgi:Protein of unknown function (DUF2764)